jgi:glycosyltransferase involved in cell wall biosynthesis
MKDDLVGRYRIDPSRVSVVANAAPVPIRPAVRRFTGPGSQVLFVGRLTAQKNVQPLVEAMERLPDVHLRLVGDGDQEAALREIVARRALGNVEFLGRLSPADVVAQYEWADALIMPSTHEGMPLVLLESLASGLPVIAADLPELREAGADAIVLLDDCGAPGIAEAVRKLLADSGLRARLSAAGQARFAGRGWEHVARDVDAVYSRARHALA